MQQIDVLLEYIKNSKGNVGNIAVTYKKMMEDLGFPRPSIRRACATLKKRGEISIAKAGKSTSIRYIDPTKRKLETVI